MAILTPALIGLLLQAATEVNGEPGIFQRSGEFPRAMHSEFPIAKRPATMRQANRFCSAICLWAATLVDRMMVLILPIIAILFPVFRLAPMAYGWRIRSNLSSIRRVEIYRGGTSGKLPICIVAKNGCTCLMRLKKTRNLLPTPLLAFADMLYLARAYWLVRKQGVAWRI